MLALNAVLLVLDTLQWILIGKPGAVMRILSLLTATVYCAMTPFPCFFWSIYADYQIYKDEDRIKKRFVPMVIPLILNLLLTFLSVFYGFLFVIDQNNIYHRGGLFYFMAGVCYFYLVYSVISIVRNRESLEKKGLHFAAFICAAALSRRNHPSLVLWGFHCVGLYGAFHYDYLSQYSKQPTVHGSFNRALQSQAVGKLYAGLD
ncbi:hypothetical protein [Caproicibacter fermentans]|uniref:hypothetical protein n=1 Tax=Caproicibacter fermentans TaxID=2576756 RepID=UPI001E4FC634|nr:hypothetical protein [Caproicibacter fermentans]